MFRVVIDETKRPNYAMIATWCPSERLEDARAHLLTARPPHRGDIHMHRDARHRATIADAVVQVHALGLRTTIVNAGRRGPNELDRRARCLTAIYAHITRAAGSYDVVLDRDDSLVQFDRRLLLDLGRRATPGADVTYRHLKARDDVMLAIPDAIGWSWARGGEWWRRVRPVVDCVLEV